MIDTSGYHFRIMIENKCKSDTEILYLEDNKEELTLFNKIRHVHKVNNHQTSDKLIAVY